MKTRVIYTKFWKDDYILSLSPTEKLVFIYLISNEHIGLNGVYELSDKVMGFETGVAPSQLKDIQERFERDRKFVFALNHVMVVNCEKYNQYKGSINEKAKETEYSLIRKEVIDALQQKLDRVSIGYPYPTDTSSNHKSEIRNKKSEIRNKKSEEIFLEKFLLEYNKLYQKNLTSTKRFNKNAVKDWLGEYKDEDIIKALHKTKLHIKKEFSWRKVMQDGKPEALFYQTTRAGKQADFIGDLLNYEPPKDQIIL